MLRAIAAVVVLTASLAACGGGDDDKDEPPRDTRRGQSLAEWRLETRELCREHTERQLGSVPRLPDTAREARRFERRLIRRERRFVVRLSRIEPPASERIGWRNAMRARRQSLDARLKGRERAAQRASGRAVAILDRKNLFDCASPGAYGLEGGASYANERQRTCRARLREVRRIARRFSALPVNETKLTVGISLGKRVRAFGRRPPLAGAVPPAVEDLERQAFREVRVAGQAIIDGMRAARRGDRPAFDRANARARRSAIRGSAAWWVLNIPACEALYSVRAN